uniref:ATP synthase F0 subunit 8 n=1 Tax=Brachyplatys subaeneus TaxID=355284 RepID=A0A2P1CLR1_9HEMI|nr:ATP synthase F0 subunit 8 [Brachyplatys subaeneus]AVJ52265.1 ATP synthase F0 subunit 8 [Brachyplatys subaeneus]UCC45912.1 ATP synthase F0 subunit 8 [Brachyplatys subaeneus]
MPQMSPLWWELLFLMFSMLLFMMNIMIYHEPYIKGLNKTQEKTINQMNWMW